MQLQVKHMSGDKIDGRSFGVSLNIQKDTNNHDDFIHISFPITNMCFTVPAFCIFIFLSQKVSGVFRIIICIFDGIHFEYESAVIDLYTENTKRNSHAAVPVAAVGQARF